MTEQEINVLGYILQNALKNITLKSEEQICEDGIEPIHNSTPVVYLNPMTGNYISSKHIALQGELKVIANRIIDKAVSNFLRNEKNTIETKNPQDLLEYAKIGLECVVDTSPYVYSDDLESVGFGLLSKDAPQKVLGKLMFGPHINFYKLEQTNNVEPSHDK